jgi:mono/diheme cytochrome c family protein
MRLRRLLSVLDKYCVTCHSDKLRTNGPYLQSVDVIKAPEEAELWEKVIRKVRGGAMPPQGMPRPDKAAIDTFAGAPGQYRDKHEKTAALLAQLGSTPGQEVKEPAPAE